MISSKKDMVVSNKMMNKQITTLHDEYLVTTPDVRQKKNGVINHIDTWHSNPNSLLLQQGATKSNREKSKGGGNNIILDLGLAYFMSFKSFTYLEILYAITMRNNQ